MYLQVNVSIWLHMFYSSRRLKASTWNAYHRDLSDKAINCKSLNAETVGSHRKKNKN